MAARRGVTVGRADGLQTGLSYDSVKFSQNAQRGSGDTMARTKLSEAKKRKIKVEVNEEVEESDDDQPKHKIINCWSGPRSLSTSLMYSFHNRGDAECFDEPLYAHYLRSEITINEINGIEDSPPRPYVDMVLDKQNADGEKVLEEMLLGDSVESSRGFRFVKHMAKHATRYKYADKYTEESLADYLENARISSW